MTHEFETESHYLCGVMVPEAEYLFCEVGFNIIKLSGKPFICFFQRNISKTVAIKGSSGNIYNEKLPEGKDWQMLGELGKITEEQAATVFKLLRDTSYPFEFTTCMEQLESLTDREMLYSVNPLGELQYCCRGSDCGCMAMPINVSSMEELKEWEQAQERTGRWILLTAKK